MFEVIKFILGDFWTFCGAVILLGLAGEIIIRIFETVFSK